MFADDTQPPDDAAPELTDRAFDALHEGDTETAHDLAAQLHALRFTSYFEIEALAFVQDGEPQQAIEVLRQGVEIAPDIWLLWQLLGNTLSDEGDFTGALDTYERAAECEGVDAHSIGYNRATVLNRLGRGKEALEILDALREDVFEAAPSLRAHIELSRLDLLLDSSDEAEIEAEVLRQAGELAESWQELEDTEMAAAWAWLAVVFRRCDDDDAAFTAIERALEEDRCCETALNYQREWNPDAEQAARSFRVMLQGEGEFDDDEVMGFFAPFMVVAANAESAINLALEREAPRWESAVDVKECEECGVCELQNVGVYYVVPYHVFPRDDEEEDDL